MLLRWKIRQICIICIMILAIIFGYVFGMVSMSKGGEGKGKAVEGRGE